MTQFTPEELLRGVGSFEHAMRTQTSIHGTVTRMPVGVVIGVLASMMQGGLSTSQIDQVIDSDFAAEAQRMRQILQMYEGDSWDLHLWHELPTGQYKVCTELCRHCRPSWRSGRTAVQADF